MPWTNPANRTDITVILNLPKEQAIANSDLDKCMTALEAFDTTNGTDFVTRVQNAIAQAQAAQSVINETPSKIRQQSFPGEGTLIFRDQARTEARSVLSASKGTIIQLLDCNALKGLTGRKQAQIIAT